VPSPPPPRQLKSKESTSSSSALLAGREEREPSCPHRCLWISLEVSPHDPDAAEEASKTDSGE